ncbi:alternative ribosome rescue aminoacyl-tRNA hydrolase ArfB [Pelomonas sp. KK5]|uniref:alternative ribosome rescue aminoacyl-tRNA hydrolase ArfB n=1 Tax=Pelomonas sp. KK5 TaxID=1855730 RepID=UPI00097C06E8|nr:alternative ribosome rescue aminoacyl-tRNA hydrolase ArfB [Pelomonas sp. KK5]
MLLDWQPAEWELDFSFVRAQGAGGQNVNKVSSAAHLRFHIESSTLPAAIKERLLALNDQRISNDGYVVIKAQEHRSQPMNRAEAVARLVALVQSVAHVPKARRATKPTWGSKQRRLEAKSVRSDIKAGRGKVKT